jgi:citrate lyase subunit beta/citryl-CoA lyase
MLNLEDGVSKEDKPFALVLCAIFLTQLKKIDKKIVVRVNALDEGGYDEIVYLNQFMPDAIRVPKIRNKKEVKSIVALLHDDIELHLSIETADAWHNLASLSYGKKVTTFYPYLSTQLFNSNIYSHNFNQLFFHIQEFFL